MLTPIYQAAVIGGVLLIACLLAAIAVQTGKPELLVGSGSMLIPLVPIAMSLPKPKPKPRAKRRRR